MKYEFDEIAWRDEFWDVVDDWEGLISYHKLESMCAFRQNVRAVLESANLRDDWAWFVTWTYAELAEETELVKDWATNRRRLERRTGACGVRVFEHGRRNGRFHVQAVVDRSIGEDVYLECQAGTRLGRFDQRPVGDGKIGSYLWKELGKSSWAGLRGRRQWDRFGKLPGGWRWICGREVRLDSPLRRCFGLAFDTREVGEGVQETVERGRWLYEHGCWGEGQAADRGDAYEGGDVRETEVVDVPF